MCIRDSSSTVDNQCLCQSEFDPLNYSELWYFGQPRVPCTSIDKRDYVYGSRDLSLIHICIEAGGPTPGVGCAGRGIITAFELIDKLHIKEQYDTIVYDVLGDVVCGGFAVPIRREYADTVFLVTSGEYMSIYAANNILRGIKNYDGQERRVAGILYNCRNVKNEDERIKAFSEAVGPVSYTHLDKK